MGQKTILLVLVLFASYSSGGPVPEEVTTVSEPEEGCTVKNITYGKGEEIPDSTPCESCICDPPNIVCSMIKCQPNNGCKIIQQPNKCCPEYKCECELEGKTYNNGEKLDNSLDPCQVCYCRGGEIMCTSITCYHRDDCPPVNIPGRCCPKYDHCPPVESASRSSNNMSNQTSKREMQPWLMTKGVEAVSTSKSPEEPPKFPQTIKIVEILPTPPAQSVETSSGPRIITNGDDYLKKTEVEVLSLSTTENTSELQTTQTDTSVSPDSEYFTTVVPTEYNHTEGTTVDGVEVTEGGGYEILSGGVFTHNEEFKASHEDSSEQKSETYPESSTVDEMLTKASSFLPNLSETSPFLKLTEATEQEDMNGPIIHMYSPSKQKEVPEMFFKAFSESPRPEDQTQPILLTPDDLRTLAEYLIHQKIKPAPVTEVNPSSYEVAPEENSVSTETEDNTSPAQNSTEDSSNATEGNSVQTEYTEETSSPKSPKINLTEQEIWAQNVLDRLTANLPLPLQGIEIIPINSTEIDNSTQVENSTETYDNATNEISSTDSTSDVEEFSDLSTKRGSLRQIQGSTTIEDKERQVRVTDKNEETSPGILDERDQMLVENFFKKNLDVN